MPATFKLTCRLCAATVTVMPYPDRGAGIPVRSMSCPACSDGVLVGALPCVPDQYRIIAFERQARGRSARP